MSNKRTNMNRKKAARRAKRKNKTNTANEGKPIRLKDGHMYTPDPALNDIPTIDKSELFSTYKSNMGDVDFEFKQPTMKDNVIHIIPSEFLMLHKKDEAFGECDTVLNHVIKTVYPSAVRLHWPEPLDATMDGVFAIIDNTDVAKHKAEMDESGMVGVYHPHKQTDYYGISLLLDDDRLQADLKTICTKVTAYMVNHVVKLDKGFVNKLKSKAGITLTHKEQGVVNTPLATRVRNKVRRVLKV